MIAIIIPAIKKPPSRSRQTLPFAWNPRLVKERRSRKRRAMKTEMVMAANEAVWSNSKAKEEGRGVNWDNNQAGNTIKMLTRAYRSVWTRIRQTRRKRGSDSEMNIRPAKDRAGMDWILAAPLTDRWQQNQIRVDLLVPSASGWLKD
jgi:hypothetical protein